MHGFHRGHSTSNCRRSGIRGDDLGRMGMCRGLVVFVIGWCWLVVLVTVWLVLVLSRSLSVCEAVTVATPHSLVANLGAA